MRIDTHVHIFPDLRYQATRLGSRAEKLVDTVAPAFEMAGQLRRKLAHRFGGSSKPSMTVEKTARLHAKGPHALVGGLESVMSVVGTPAMLAGAGTIDRLLASMDRFEIDRSVVIAGPPVAPNLWVIEECQRVDDTRLIPVACLPDLPRTERSMMAWQREFEALADAGAAGFKIHNNVEGLDPEHPAFRALFEVAQARNRFVILHTGCFHVFFYKNKHGTEPAHFEQYFRDYPDVRVCLAHMNRAHPERAWEVMLRHPSVYADTSWQPADAIARAVATVGADRLLLGSDWPLLHDDLQGESADILFRALPGEVAEQIACDNALRFLGET